MALLKCDVDQNLNNQYSNTMAIVSSSLFMYEY